MASSHEHEPNTSPGVDPTLPRRFRQQTEALGALWILLGFLTSVASLIVLFMFPEEAAQYVRHSQVVLILAAVMGAIWFVLGVLTLLRFMWAVSIGLILGYFSLVGNVLTLNIVGAVIMIAIIIQAHIVNRLEYQMRVAGLPLTAKPPRPPESGQ